jgi:Cytotoxic translational repressor of toxin-antitoxin stability system
MTYTVIVKKSVLKEMQKIPRQFRARIWSELRKLEKEPFPQSSKKILGYDHMYRIKAAKDYRIVYEIMKKILTITIIRIRHRKDAYKEM